MRGSIGAVSECLYVYSRYTRSYNTPYSKNGDTEFTGYLRQILTDFRAALTAEEKAKFRTKPV